MTDLNLEPKRPEHPLNSIDNERFRAAFQIIARAALPFMDVSSAYATDLLYDAHSAARMDEGDVRYIVVRETGTSLYETAEAVIHATVGPMHHEMGVKAVLRVTQGKHSLAVEVV